MASEYDDALTFLAEELRKNNISLDSVTDEITGLQGQIDQLEVTRVNLTMNDINLKTAVEALQKVTDGEPA